MFSYIWPIGLVVLSNVFYQVAAKSTPEGVDPFAALVITYGIGLVASLVLFFTIGRGGNIFKELGKLNWSSIVLGISIVGLEAGYMYAYKVGWPVSTAQIVQSAILACILIVVGALLFKEEITWNKIVGTFVCLAGLWLIGINK